MPQVLTIFCLLVNVVMLEFISFKSNKFVGKKGEKFFIFPLNKNCLHIIFVIQFLLGKPENLFLQKTRNNIRLSRLNVK